MVNQVFFSNLCPVLCAKKKGAFGVQTGMDPTPLHMRVGRQALLARLRTPGQTSEITLLKMTPSETKNLDINRVARELGCKVRSENDDTPKSTTL